MAPRRPLRRAQRLPGHPGPRARRAARAHRGRSRQPAQDRPVAHRRRVPGPAARHRRAQPARRPADGGDTMWASLYAAHDALSPVLQERIADLDPGRAPGRVVPPHRRAAVRTRHLRARGRGVRGRDAPARARPPGDRSARAVPVRRLRPRHHRAAPRRVASRSSRCSAAGSTTRTCRCRWQWQPDDVAIWDERCTNHRGLSDHYPAHRLRPPLHGRRRAPSAPRSFESQVSVAPAVQGSRLGLVIGSSLDANPFGVRERLVFDVAGADGQPCAIEVDDCGAFVVLLRHGRRGDVPAHLVDHHANVRALCAAGCDRVVALGSGGGLHPHLGPGTVLVPDDFLALGAYPTFHETTAGYAMAIFDATWRAAVVERLARGRGVERDRRRHVRDGARAAVRDQGRDPDAREVRGHRRHDRARRVRARGRGRASLRRGLQDRQPRQRRRRARPRGRGVPRERA